MQDVATTKPSKTLVRVNGRDFTWDAETGLDRAVAEAVHAFICLKANQLKELAAARGLCVEDLIQEGYVGALEAAKRFDPFRGVQFITYAGFWIKQAQLSVLREASIHIPVRGSYAN